MPSRVIYTVLAAIAAAILMAAIYIGFWPVPDLGSGFDYAVTVHSDDGSEIAEFYRERRFYVPAKGIPEHVKKAFVAAEDRRFYDHHGFDIKGIARAATRNISAKTVVEGGSTITQQLAKMLLKRQDRSFSRKFTETLLAFRLERKYTKDEILAAYLNIAFFGERVYGIEAAARTYFNKSTASLGISDAAMLAGLQKAPSRYSPLKNPAKARERMITVLREMRALKFISHDEYVRALSAPLPKSADFRRKYDAPYFIDYIRGGLSAKYGDSMHQKGLHVYSTINRKMQALAEESVRNGVDRIERRTRPGVQAALIALDLSSGEIKAMVGGTEYGNSQFNRAVMAFRQPGSAFKPFVYAAALETGMSLSDSILDVPVRILDPDTGQWWTPRNAEGEYLGLVSLKTAFALSLNSATVRLAQKIGFQSIREEAEKCGIRGNVRAHPSIALGSFEVTLLDLTAAYMVFATGEKVTPMPYVLLRDKKGEDLDLPSPSYREILPQEMVDKMRALLRAPIEDGIAGMARAVGRPVYGKTGTTNDNSDAWFIGFDDHIAVGVWVGRDDHTSLGGWETGSEAALPIWTDFMKKVKYDE